MIWPRKSARSASANLVEALFDRAERLVVDAVILDGAKGLEVVDGKGFDIGIGENAKIEQAGMDVVEQIGVGGFAQIGGFVIGLEGLADGVGVVDKVEHHGLMFIRDGCG